MAYTILYHHKVKESDIPAIDKTARVRISTAIETRLTIEPEKYGHPLRKPLSGYWKLRVGDYRVVYKVNKNEVWVLAILHRSVVYKIVSQRI
ncbi:MAG: type II toxin-antitoxin system RelE/ParE family toxin [Candidatus Brocadiia bacterium]